ncbi:hypothetical protein T10_6665, partial [Trichinella papuae]
MKYSMTLRSLMQYFFVLGNPIFLHFWSILISLIKVVSALVEMGIKEITNGLGRTLPDCVFHEILQNSHMELKYDFNGGEWKRNQICNLK